MNIAAAAAAITATPNGKPTSTSTASGNRGLGSNSNSNSRSGVNVKVSSSSSSMTGSLYPSPNVSVTSTSTGKRVAGSSSSSNSTKGNSSVNNSSNGVINRVKELGQREQQQQQKDQGQGQFQGIHFTSKGNKDSKEVTLQGDLRNIMHAFGDGTSPSEDSVQLMELILRQEMMAFLFICDTAAYWGGGKVLGLKECIYALRNDKPFLSRLFKYLIVKDQQQRVLRASQAGQTNSSKIIAAPRNYYTEIRGILEELDGSGELERLLDLDNNLDNEKSDKDKPVGGGSTPYGGDRDKDINILRLISPKYINYAKARSISFARKLPQLQEWVSIYLHSEFKLNQSFMEILAFLVYELVAQIVDLSFVIKRERSSGANPSLKFSDPRGSNPDTCMSSSVFLRKDEECNNVSEMLVLASELEAKRLKKVSSTSNREIFITKSVHCLSPSEIREAYIRMQNSQCPSISFRSRAEKIKQFNFQY